MIFLREECKPILKPTLKKLTLELSRVKSSFASLTADDGSYLQVAGGPGLFLLEFQDAGGGHFRARQDNPVAAHPDGTILPFSAGRVSMARADWFLLRQVTETFDSFLAGKDWPDFVQWRKLESNFAKHV